MDIQETDQEIRPHYIMGLPEFPDGMHIAVYCHHKGINMDRMGRNEPCPCSSGKKFKKCCIKEKKQDLAVRFWRLHHQWLDHDMAGDFVEGNIVAREHNELLKILTQIDPRAMKDFEEKPIRTWEDQI